MVRDTAQLSGRQLRAALKVTGGMYSGGGMHRTSVMNVDRVSRTDVVATTVDDVVVDVCSGNGVVAAQY